ncbi:hypothetical protein [Pseudonocardia asaccharolytica]|uniref:Terminase n=1 Tax=Pseudonocardia asaccharolytica DSM 44247 = NBRC 16224 TaxID=1123024 RepID=A0A511CYP6_9PSEU|nr:hypothetical protein [Pseudonocardia asaccharolytica]GEL17679.1 hypothetical protein PA7_15160 [Pseudonocardia asaccharolytica DSM 44247 = NBRC 16224]
MTVMLERPAQILGRTEPRLWTRPLVTGPPGPCGCGCALTPATSLGFEAIEFAAEVLGVQLLPWQRWWLIHALELRPEGGYRFRTLLTLIARQNGKTTLLKIVALWAMYMGRAELVLGAAQSLDIARESWAGAVALARGNDELAAEVENVRRANGEICLTLTNGARYRITAATDEAGRGLSVDLLVLDELRAQRDTGAWAALSKTTSARPNGLIVGISNAGSDQSVVLNTLRSAALAETEPTLGLFEWSAPDGCELDDVDGWAAANPALGRTLSAASVRTSLATDPAEVFRTEVLCQHVDALDSALDAAGWKAGADPAGSLAAVRARVAAVVDVAPDGAHVTLGGAALLDDGRVRVEIFGAWSSTEDARRELAELLARIGPAAVGWLPAGPAAALAPELRALGAVEIKGQQVHEACQGLADLVQARRILHPADPLLDAHVAGAQRLHTGDGWRFARRGAGHVDAVYAVAGAVHLARTVPEPVVIPRSRIF